MLPGRCAVEYAGRCGSSIVLIGYGIESAAVQQWRMPRSRRLYSLSETRRTPCACGKLHLAAISATEYEKRKSGAWTHGFKMCESVRFLVWQSGDKWDRRAGEYVSV